MKKLIVCIPTIDGKVCWETMSRLRLDEDGLNQAGWLVGWKVVVGSSLVHIARNELVAGALADGADVIAFVDADMDWEDGAIVKLLRHDKDVIAAAYPKKIQTLQFNTVWLDDRQITPDPATGLIEVATTGTGFMLIKRNVFEKLAAALGPEYRYNWPDGRPERVAYFECPTSYGEDTSFCLAWRKIGGQIWVDPSIAMTHIIAPRWSMRGRLSDWLAERRRPAS